MSHHAAKVSSRDHVGSLGSRVRVMLAFALMRMGSRVVDHIVVSGKRSCGEPVAGQPREPAVRLVARFVIAALLSEAAALWWWDGRPRQLRGVIDIVGYPTFGNFNYLAPFTAYHLAVYGFPIGVLLIYSLLAWRGPLRRPVRSRAPGAIQVRDVAAADVPAAGPVGAGLSLVGRLILPAGVVALEASSRSTLTTARSVRFGVICALCYLAGVLALAGLLTWRSRRAGALFRQARMAIAEVNGVAGAVAVVAGLWFVSRHSVVLVHADHSARWWPWLPWWPVLLGVLAIAGWAVWRRTAGVSPVQVESRLLTVVVGAVLVFVAFSALPGQIAGFQGFDDAQNLVGANFLAHGLFPWRDQLFIHGLYVDVLQGNMGFALFGDTRWGGDAVMSVVLNPLSWVGLYLFVAWFSGAKRWFLGGFVVLLAAGLLDTPDGRFIAVPAVLVLLAEALRRGRLAWYVALTSVLFIQAVLIPETIFLVVPALLTVLAADLAGRDRAGGLWRALRPSRWCALTGVVLTVIWCAFLAANHGLGPFLSYYQIFGPGHNEAGVIPPDWNIRARHYIEFGLGIVLVLLTFWAAARRLRARRPWTERDWVTVAAAGFVALYGEKAIGRFDAQHVGEVFTATLPLALLWAQQALRSADRLLCQVARSLGPAARHGQRQRVGYLSGNLATILAVLLLVIALPAAAGTPSVVTRVAAIPQQQRAFASTEPPIPRLGYTVPGTVNIAFVRDLGTVLDTYAGRHAPVFDMTNGLGYFYYLLDRRPGTRFVHVSMAEPPFAQEMLINELKLTRPPLVIFDGRAIGLPEWDGIRNNVRHYLVSQYLLDGWQPLLVLNGELLMLRRDLIAARPALPPMNVPASTTDLWFSSGQCNWGSVPNFLGSRPRGRSIDIAVTSLGQERLVNIRGWALDPGSPVPANEVVLVDHGAVVASVRPNLAHWDLASSIGPGALRSGFSIDTPVAVGGSLPAVFALTRDGLLHPLGWLAASLGLSGSLRMPDGSLAAVGAPTPGAVEAVAFASGPVTVGRAKVPRAVTLADFDLLTFHAARSIGPADLSVTDRLTGGQGREISAHALASSASSLPVRVGSCLQWHGFSSRTLYVLQAGGSPVTGLRLSGVG